MNPKPQTAEQRVALDAYLASLKPRDLYPPEVQEARFERTLLNMLRMPPDPRNVRTKQHAKAAKAKRKRWNNQAVMKAFKAKGKSADLNYVFSEKAPGNSMMLAVHNAVPSGINSAIRNDLCQDLLLGLISGAFQMKELKSMVSVYLRAARQFTPHAGDQNAWAEDIGSESWKQQYRPTDERSMEERVSDLAEHWATGKTPEVRKNPEGDSVIWPKSPRTTIGGWTEDQQQRRVKMIPKWRFPTQGRVARRQMRVKKR